MKLLELTFFVVVGNEKKTKGWKRTEMEKTEKISKVEETIMLKGDHTVRCELVNSTWSETTAGDI